MLHKCTLFEKYYMKQSIRICYDILGDSTSKSLYSINPIRLDGCFIICSFATYLHTFDFLLTNKHIQQQIKYSIISNFKQIDFKKNNYELNNFLYVFKKITYNIDFRNNNNPFISDNKFDINLLDFDIDVTKPFQLSKLIENVL